MENAAIAPFARFSRRFWPLFALGLLGIAALPFNILPALRQGAALDVLPQMSTPGLVALMLVNPLLMLAAMTALGAAVAHRVGLHALLAGVVPGSRWAVLRAAAPLAVGLGLVLAVVTVLIDLAAQPFLSPEWTAATARAEGGILPALVVGVLYGGITEEILLRWGLMSFLAWAGWRLFARNSARPGPAIMWIAIVLAALLFGVGHLPAAAAVASLDAALVLRTVLLNALAGIVFGWLFWKRHLEAAMLAHASTHVGFALLRLAGVI